MTLRLTGFSETDILLVNSHYGHMSERCACLRVPPFPWQSCSLEILVSRSADISFICRSWRIANLPLFAHKEEEKKKRVCLCFFQYLSGLPCRLSWDALLLTLPRVKAEKASQRADGSRPSAQKRLRSCWSLKSSQCPMRKLNLGL